MAAGQISAVGLAQAAITRIEHYDRTINAPLPSAQSFVPVTRARLRRSAFSSAITSISSPARTLSRERARRWPRLKVPRQRPSWQRRSKGLRLAAVPHLVPVASDDRMIQPAAQKMMGNRAAPPDHIVVHRESLPMS
jgi:hypothetical protein